MNGATWCFDCAISRFLFWAGDPLIEQNYEAAQRQLGYPGDIAIYGQRETMLNLCLLHILKDHRGEALTVVREGDAALRAATCQICHRGLGAAPDATRTKFLEVLPTITTVYRKGEPVVDRESGGLHIFEVYAYPHQDARQDDHPIFDLHFVSIAVEPAQAQAQKGQFIAWLDSYPQPERLAGGPTYSEVAAVAGVEQETAFRVFALGAALGLWKIITPEVMGLTGEEADALAGQGFVLITGYTPVQA